MANKNFKVRQGLEAPLIAADDGTTAITISNSTGNIALAGTLDVQGGTITESTGALSITTGAGNGNITLTPNGSGTVIVSSDLAVNGATSADITTTTATASVFNATATTLNIGAGATTVSIGANTGTLTIGNPTVVGTQTTQNLYDTTATTLNIGGAATTTNIGAKTGSSIVNGTNRFTSPTIYGLSGGATTPSRGVMISNGNAGSAANARNSLVLRTYPVTGSARGNIIFESSRGTETTPTAIQSGDLIGELVATGYATNGFISDYVASVPGQAFFTPTENWANTGGPYPTAGTITAAGMGFQLGLMPTATTLGAGNSGRINVLNINPQTFASRSDSYTWSQGKTGTTQMMSLGSSGNFAIKDASAGGTIYFQTYKDGSNHIVGSINQIRATTGDEFAVMNFTTQRSTDGINYTPTQSGDIIGSFKFNGNANTSTSPGAPAGPGAQIYASATENWTALANGTRFVFFTIQTGTIADFQVISGSSDNLDLKSTQTRIQDVSGNAVLTVNATDATFAQPVGFPVKTAAQWNAITGAVGRQVCVSNSAGGGHPNGMMAFWDTTNARWSYIHDNSAV